jgi:hypothetical protein
MSSNSETSYGARIGNAEKLVAALQNFNNYQAIKPEYSIANYTIVIKDLKEQNNTVALKKQNYSLAVDNRKHTFDVGVTSIDKLLSPINSAVKVSFGRTAKEATDVASIIAKIRGANIKSKKNADPNQETVSQSYQSYNSRVQFFADLIVNLANFNTNYQPANPNLTVTELNNLYAKAIDANNQVMDKFTQFIQNNDTRLDSYHQLSQTAIRIKDAVKGQYGNTSAEYKLISGLKI